MTLAAVIVLDLIAISVTGYLATKIARALGKVPWLVGALTGLVLEFGRIGLVFLIFGDTITNETAAWLANFRVFGIPILIGVGFMAGSAALQTQVPVGAPTEGVPDSLQPHAAEASPTEFKFRHVRFVPDQQTWNDLRAETFKTAFRAGMREKTGEVTVRTGSVVFKDTVEVAADTEIVFTDLRELELVTTALAWPGLRMAYGPDAVAYFSDASVRGNRDIAAEIMNAIKDLNPDVRVVTSGDEPPTSS